MLTLGGCASHASLSPVQSAPPPARTLVSVSGPATAPADAKARLSLAQIDPRVSFPATVPTTAPSEPPVEAVRLYAQARIATLEGRRYAAAQLLEKAIALDPGSFELHNSLADVYVAGSDPRALREWESAAEIEPDRLDTQIQLGRQYVIQGDFDTTLQHLWMALGTADYKRDHPSSGEADFLLARVLQQQGYDRAALQLYERLLSRLAHAPPAVRRNPQLMMLLMHPESLALRIASLYEKHGEFGPALKLLGGVAEHDPSDFDVQARIVRDTAATGDKPAAVRSATGLIARFHADPQSLQLLRELTGSDSAATEALQRLRHDRPDDRQVLYALADLMAAQHRPDADRLIEEGLRRWPDDPPLLRRQVNQLRSRRQLAEAAKLLVTALARRPDRELELTPLWDTLIRPSEFGWLRISDLQNLSVASELEPARLVLLARAAALWRRDGLQRYALTRAVETRPLCPSAFREALTFIWLESSKSQQEKEEAGKRLIASASQAGDAALAAELNAKLLLNRKQAPQAALAFADAVKAGDRCPELYLNFAAALHALGNDDGAQTLLWKLIGDRPFCQDAYVQLYDVYETRKDAQGAGKVLATWLTADPESAAARRAEAREAFAARRFDVAERILLDLFEHHSDDPDVLSALQQFFAQADRLGEFTAKLERRLAAEPWNFTLATVLAETYADRQQVAEATHTADQMRHLAARDPDLLYRVASVYARIGNTSAADQVLKDVLAIDSSYASAGNDLAYSWAEQGRNLDDAETLVRRAVSSEPDNASFLDSMGWVLYKRGKFAEALESLKKAAGPESQADPIVLDHLGDALYQIGDRDQAARRWQQAASRLSAAGADDGNELKQLRSQLFKKQQQLTAGQPVNVAPVIERR
jgi:predicted Zn-dependent protease